MGHSDHIAPAMLNILEELPVKLLDFSALYLNSARTPEEACIQMFREARQATPSIVYIPRIMSWWEVAMETLRGTFTSVLNSLPPDLPLLVLATTEYATGKGCDLWSLGVWFTVSVNRYHLIYSLVLFVHPFYLSIPYFFIFIRPFHSANLPESLTQLFPAVNSTCYMTTPPLLHDRESFFYDILLKKPLQNPPDKPVKSTGKTSFM